MALLDDVHAIAEASRTQDAACELTLLAAPGPRRQLQGARFRVDRDSASRLAAIYLDGVAVAAPNEPPTGGLQFRPLDLTQNEILRELADFTDGLEAPEAHAPRNFISDFKARHGPPKAGILTYAYDQRVVRIFVGIAGLSMKPTRMVFGENGLRLSDVEQLALGQSIALLGGDEAIGDDNAVERLLGATVPSADLAERAVERSHTLATALAGRQIRWTGGDPTTQTGFWTRIRQRRLDAAARRARWENLTHDRIEAYVTSHGGQAESIGGELRINLAWDTFIQVIDDLPSESQIGQEEFLDPSTERTRPG
jgi:hypothetical protein